MHSRWLKYWKWLNINLYNALAFLSHFWKFFNDFDRRPVPLDSGTILVVWEFFAITQWLQQLINIVIELSFLMYSCTYYCTHFASHLDYFLGTGFVTPSILFYFFSLLEIKTACHVNLLPIFCQACCMATVIHSFIFNQCCVVRSKPYFLTMGFIFFTWTLNPPLMQFYKFLLVRRWALQI